MDLGTIYSNLESFESTVTSTNTHTLSIYSRKIVIVNDSNTKELVFYPQGIDSGNSMTLKPTETITLDRFRSLTISVTGSNVPYRIWVFG